MSACLSDDALDRVHADLGSIAERAHLAACAACTGRSAIPYLHVNDAVSFLRRVLDLAPALTPGEVLVASPDGATSHEELFEAATLSWFGARKKPFHIPKLLCGPGMAARDLLGRLTGERPFEQLPYPRGKKFF